MDRSDWPAAGRQGEDAYSSLRPCIRSATSHVPTLCLFILLGCVEVPPPHQGACRLLPQPC